MNLSDLIPSGGKLRYQEFTSSGTFTPSAKLLANGGQLTVVLVGGSGGNGGGDGGTSFLGRPGHPGEARIRQVTVTGPVTVTIGAGGAAGTGGSPGSFSGGTAGGSTSFGSASAAGGPAGGTLQNGSIQQRLRDYRLTLVEAVTPGTQGQPSVDINSAWWGAGSAGNPGFARVIWTE